MVKGVPNADSVHHEINIEKLIIILGVILMSSTIYDLALPADNKAQESLEAMLGHSQYCWKGRKMNKLVKSHWLFVLFLALSLYSDGYAADSKDENSKRKLIESNLVAKVSDYDSAVVTNLVEQRVLAGSKLIEPFNLSDEAGRALTKEYSESLKVPVTKLFNDLNVSLSNLRDAQIDELESQFSQSELQQVVDFFTSDLGKRYSQISLKHSAQRNQTSKTFQDKLSKILVHRNDVLIQQTKKSAVSEIDLSQN